MVAQETSQQHAQFLSFKVLQKLNFNMADAPTTRSSSAEDSFCIPGPSTVCVEFFGLHILTLRWLSVYDLVRWCDEVMKL